MRYVLWSGKASGIGLPKTHHEARRLIDATAGWRPALAELAARRRLYDPHIGISCLEVQCHGGPAELELSDRTPRGRIDHTTVHEFGTLLRPHLATGALIELMACLVARVGTEIREVVPEGAIPHAYNASINSQYWDVLEGDAARQWEAQGRTVPASVAGLNHTRYGIYRAYQWPPESDGLSFCLALAAASGAIVRASSVSQLELPDNDTRRAIDTFGNWEGNVWDFLPSGGVKYLGYAFQRTQPVVTWRPDDAIHNPRPMTGLTADVGLRAGRPNRNPLPV